MRIFLVVKNTIGNAGVFFDLEIVAFKDRTQAQHYLKILKTSFMEEKKLYSVRLI